MKNIIFKAAFSAATIASAITFADDAQVRNLDNRVTALEQRKGSNSMILPPAGPNIDNDIGVLFGVEYLYLKPHVTGLGNATVYDTGSYSIDNGTPLTTLSDTFLDWKNFSGSRVFIGMRPDHDSWELKASWTYLHATAKSNVSVTGTKELVPYYENTFVSGGQVETGYPKNVSAKWRMNLNIIDLDVSRNCYVSKWLAVRPYAGLRNMWQYQNIATTYGQATRADAATYSSSSLMINNFWGIGPKVGMESRWGLGQGYSVVADAAASLLWGYYKTNTQANDSTTPAYSYINQHSAQHSDLAIIDLSLAFVWDRNFYDNQYHISFKAGWEHHMFFDNNMFTSEDYPNGSTTLQGLVIGGRFDF